MEQWVESWQLKVFGYIHLTKLALERTRPRRSGIVVNIIGAGSSPRWDYAAGSTGNAGLAAFTRPSARARSTSAHASSASTPPRPGPTAS